VKKGSKKEDPVAEAPQVEEAKPNISRHIFTEEIIDDRDLDLFLPEHF